MSKITRVDDSHYRITDDNKRTSRLYENSGNIFIPDDCVEVTDHHSNGTSTSYEADNSLWADFWFGGRGKKK